MVDLVFRGFLSCFYYYLLLQVITVTCRNDDEYRFHLLRFQWDGAFVSATSVLIVEAVKGPREVTKSILCLLTDASRRGSQAGDASYVG